MYHQQQHIEKVYEPMRQHARLQYTTAHMTKACVITLLTQHLNV
jgi:hypothetical protein